MVDPSLSVDMPGPSHADNYDDDLPAAPRVQRQSSLQELEMIAMQNEADLMEHLSKTSYADETLAEYPSGTSCEPHQQPTLCRQQSLFSQIAQNSSPNESCVQLDQIQPSIKFELPIAHEQPRFTPSAPPQLANPDAIRERPMSVPMAIDSRKRGIRGASLEDGLRPPRPYNRKAPEEKEGELYQVKRARNNIAVRKSRAKAKTVQALQGEELLRARVLIDSLQREKAELVTENQILKGKVDFLNARVKTLECATRRSHAT